MATNQFDERRRIRRKRRDIEAKRRACNVAMTGALVALIGLGGFAEEQADVENITMLSPAITPAPIIIETKGADELTSTMTGTAVYIPVSRRLLEGIVALDIAYQQQVFSVCDRDPQRFAFLMALACIESEFDITKVGDGGASLGLFQINTSAQGERLQSLGYDGEDMYSPTRAAEVALDYIDWLRCQLRTEDYDSHLLCMAYNMGLTGATSAVSSGIVKTAYSTRVLDQYKVYAEALGVEP